MSYRVAAAPAPSSTAFRQVTTMAKKKGVRIIVTLECTEARGLGETPSRYCTQKVQLAVVVAGRTTQSLHLSLIDPVAGTAESALYHRAACGGVYI